MGGANPSLPVGTNAPQTLPDWKNPIENTIFPAPRRPFSPLHRGGFLGRPILSSWVKSSPLALVGPYENTGPAVPGGAFPMTGRHPFRPWAWPG